MKIVHINGSPRGLKSLSRKLALDFIQGLHDANQDQASMEVQELVLAREHFKSCTGCFTCWKQGGTSCILKDGAQDWLVSMDQADLVVWNFPLYHFGMPALVKNLIERSLSTVQGTIIPDGAGAYTHPHKSQGRTTAPLGPRPRHVFITTAGFPTTLHNHEALWAHLELLFGLRSQGWEGIDCVQGELLDVAALDPSTRPYREAVQRAGMELFPTIKGGGWRGFSPEVKQRLTTPFLDTPTFLALANASWSMVDNPGQDSTAYVEGLLSQMAILCNTHLLPKDKPSVFQFTFAELGKPYWILIKEGRATLCKNSTTLPPQGDAHWLSIETNLDTWKGISEGRLDGQESLMDGGWKARGSMELLTIMGKGLFSPKAASVASDKGHQVKDTGVKPNLGLSLAPWILVWIGLAMPLAPTMVVLVALLAHGFLALLPRVGTSNPGYFDRVTPLGLVALGLLSILLPQPLENYVFLSISYGIVACIWFASVFGSPLTSHYSAQDYGPELQENKVFLGVNRIMTGLWAILFGLNAGLVLTLGWLGVPGYGIALCTNGIMGLGGIITGKLPGYLASKALGLKD